MNITLKQLRVFCALYELRSFTAAARAAFVTQSAVSKLCAELEAEVGQPLFERSTRNVTPCEGAADFYAYAQEILGTVRAAERSMSGLRTLERGVVGVASSPMMMVGLLGDVITRYHRLHGGVKLELLRAEYGRHAGTRPPWPCRFRHRVDAGATAKGWRRASSTAIPCTPYAPRPTRWRGAPACAGPTWRRMTTSRCAMSTACAAPSTTSAANSTWNSIPASKPAC